MGYEKETAPLERGVRNVICKSCGEDNDNTANFCRTCATKLKTVCDCWVKKEPHNCGQEQCPGYRLLFDDLIRRGQDNF